ncbi:MAG: AAA family ATPase, partial [Lachnospiraceae bacterium]|nr:AAA family ATPase [Lachnospiraceae bacterium]
MGEVFAIVSGKGGTGKTTAAANVGAALSAAGMKTLLMDLNFITDDLSVHLGIEKRIAYNLTDVLESNCRIIQALVTDSRLEGLYVLPASGTRELRVISKASFVKLVSMLKQSFDCILIDTPTGFCPGTDYALAAADSAVLVTTPDRISVRDTKKLLQHPDFSGVRKSLLINRFSRQRYRNYDFPSPEDIALDVGEALLGIIPEDDMIAAAAENGFVLTDFMNGVGKTFDNVAGRLLGEDIPINLKKIGLK